MTTTQTTTRTKPKDLFAARRAFDAKLAAIDAAQHASPAAIEAKRAEDEARLHGYDAMADGMRHERENAEIFSALHRGDTAAYLRLSAERDRRSKLKARGLTS